MGREATARSGEPMRCPSCGSRLVELERADVLIDACPECRGVWLDRGELDKILVKERQLAAGGRADDDFFSEMEGRRPTPQPQREDYREQPRRKRRSFLEDLLDFD
jgi:Zn-finger nucleic acid-binding protein